MHIECEIPARGLIGLRSHMLTATAGEAVMYHCFQKYAPSRTTIYKRANGVPDRYSTRASDNVRDAQYFATRGIVR